MLCKAERKKKGKRFSTLSSHLILQIPFFFLPKTFLSFFFWRHNSLQLTEWGEERKFLWMKSSFGVGWKKKRRSRRRRRKKNLMWGGKNVKTGTMAEVNTDDEQGMRGLEKTNNNVMCFPL